MPSLAPSAKRGAKDFLGHDPLSGHLFLFIGRSKDRLKILYWEGTFRLPRQPSPAICLPAMP